MKNMLMNIAISFLLVGCPLWAQEPHEEFSWLTDSSTVDEFSKMDQEPAQVFSNLINWCQTTTNKSLRFANRTTPTAETRGIVKLAIYLNNEVKDPDLLADFVNLMNSTESIAFVDAVRSGFYHGHLHFHGEDADPLVFMIQREWEEFKKMPRPAPLVEGSYFIEVPDVPNEKFHKMFFMLHNCGPLSEKAVLTLFNVLDELYADPLLYPFVKKAALRMLGSRWPDQCQKSMQQLQSLPDMVMRTLSLRDRFGKENISRKAYLRLLRSYLELPPEYWKNEDFKTSWTLYQDDMFNLFVIRMIDEKSKAHFRKYCGYMDDLNESYSGKITALQTMKAQIQFSEIKFEDSSLVRKAKVLNWLEAYYPERKIRFESED